MIWEADRGWHTTAPFSEPEAFDFPEGIGPVECVNVEHEEVRAGGVTVSPRDVVAACLPDPATLGDRMRGKTCAGTFVTGVGKDGEHR